MLDKYTKIIKIDGFEVIKNKYPQSLSFDSWSKKVLDIPSTKLIEEYSITHDFGSYTSDIYKDKLEDSSMIGKIVKVLFKAYGKPLRDCDTFYRKKIEGRVQTITLRIILDHTKESMDD